MRIATKFGIVFLCVALALIGKTAAFAWYSNSLLHRSNLATHGSCDRMSHLLSLQTLLHRNASALRGFLAAKRLETLQPPTQGSQGKTFEAERDEAFYTLRRIRQERLLCRTADVQPTIEADGQDPQERAAFSALEAEITRHETSVQRVLELAEEDVAAALDMTNDSLLPNLEQKLLPALAEQARSTQVELKRLRTGFAEKLTLANSRFLKVSAAVVAALLAVGFTLSGLFTRPIRRLCQDAMTCTEDALTQRFRGGDKNEVEIVRATLRGALSDLKKSNTALEWSNRTLEKRLQERASELEEAHGHLRQAQFELVKNEKLNMLGQLSAGMAHEVNTPTGTILNASVEISERLRELLASVVRLGELPDETRAWFAHMCEVLLNGKDVGSEAATRRERRSLEARLQQKGYSQPRKMAEVIVALGTSELLDDEELLKKLSDERVLAALEQASGIKVLAHISETSARRIARVVRSLRSYAYDSKGEVLDLDVNETVDNALVILHNRTKSAAEVTANLQEHLPSVKCGAELLQVWINILSNACDAIEESHREGLGRIDITSRKGDAELVVVEISNDGPAIPEDVIHKICEPFFTTKRMGKGMGLGLSICTRILQQWGGSMSVRNENGRVVFEVGLPTTQGVHLPTYIDEIPVPV